MSLKIERLSQPLQDKIMEMKAQGLSNSAIVDQIKTNFNEEVTPSDVFVYFSRRQDKMMKALKDSGQFEKKMAEKYFDTIDQISNLNAEIWEYYYNMKDKPEHKVKSVVCPECDHPFKVEITDFNTLLKAADHILKQIQHVDSVLGRLQNKSLNITYNILDMNKKIEVALPQMLERLKKEGRLDSILRQLKKKKKEIIV